MATKPTGEPVGRPSLLKDPVRSAILAAVRTGCPYKFAAEAAGISARTLHEWLRHGKEDISLKKHTSTFAVLLRDIKGAEAQGIAYRLRIIQRASKKQWQAAAWTLERVHPAHFGDARKEIREMKKALAEVITLLAEMKPPSTHPPGASE